MCRPDKMRESALVVLGRIMMQTRREVIRSFAVGAAVVYPMDVQATRPRTIDICRRASELADIMAEATGGQWRVSVDEKLEFILISKVV